MKKAIAIAILTVITTSAAFAACPPYAPYRCVPGPMGKMICGCGV